MPKEKLFCVAGVAERLNCTSRHVYNLIREGRLDAVRIGIKGIRVPQGAVDKFMSKNQIDIQGYDA